MQKRLRIKRDGASAWLLYDADTASTIGGIEYKHAPDGNHYRAWLFVDGSRCWIDSPLPQLAMAARAVEDARASLESKNR